jgi:hypothetical protein
MCAEPPLILNDQFLQELFKSISSLFLPLSVPARATRSALNRDETLASVHIALKI